MGDINRDVCEVEFRGNAVLVRICGSLDARCARRVERTLRRVGMAGPARIVVDLRDLGPIDDDGVDVLVGMLARAERDGVEVALVQRDGAVQRAGAATRARRHMTALA